MEFEDLLFIIIRRLGIIPCRRDWLNSVDIKLEKSWVHREELCWNLYPNCYQMNFNFAGDLLRFYICIYNKIWTSKMTEKGWFCFLYVAILLKKGKKQVFFFYHLYIFYSQITKWLTSSIIILTNIQLISAENIEGAN